METIRLTLSDDIIHQLEARQQASPHVSLEQVATREIRAALQFLPSEGGRVVVVHSEVLERLEKILGGGSIWNVEDLEQKITRLAGISFEHIRLPMTPGQLEQLQERADRQGLTVEQLIERTVPRIYEQFFNILSLV